MSREFTNYQTLLNKKQSIIREFEDKKEAVLKRRSAAEGLQDSFFGDAGTVFQNVTSEMLNAIDSTEKTALEKLDADIATWYDQLSDAEKVAANEFKNKIGL